MDDRQARAVLGLPLDATRGQAQRAFRWLAKQTHPDAGGKAADFRAVTDAWAAVRPLLPPDPAPHVLAYRAATGRVVWAEPRRSVQPVRQSFAAVLRVEVARLAR